MSEKAKLSTEPYKGVRDFYPEDMAVRNYIFATMREVAERFGYEEYDASILEPTELYESKSSEEIVSEQTYTFEDRGGRRVTLRPEMTPTVARMVAARRRELALPLRLYSIPNVFRYERPQRGRLREHWQLNCDLFGVSNIAGDIEAISLAYEIMKNFGADDTDFSIRINSRAIIPETIATICKSEGVTLTDDQIGRVIRLIDRKSKMEEGAYAQALEEIIGPKGRMALLLHFTSENVQEFMLNTQAGQQFFPLLDALPAHGIKNIVHDHEMVRGFDYYTGTIFEVFDTSPDNRRALFGGGRYDRILDVFGVEPLPAVGFGMGDVAFRDFLETHKLLPEYRSTTSLYIAIADADSLSFAAELAQALRAQGINVAVDPTLRKLGDQIKAAAKKKIPFVTVVGTNERTTGVFVLKDLVSGREITVDADTIADTIFESEIV